MLVEEKLKSIQLPKSVARTPKTGESSSVKRTTHAQTTSRAIVRPNSHKWKPAFTELEWFRPYLGCRQQYCTLNGQKSSPQQVTCGMLQGSCLGPLLVILYLNDFESCLKFSKANLYAGDKEVSFSSNELSDVTRNF